MQSKELIKAVLQGNLGTVERLLAIEAVKKNAHANNNAALLLAAMEGHVAVVERLLTIEAVKENAHAGNNAALRLLARGGHLAAVERLLAIELVKENAHGWNNKALQSAARQGHLAVVERLLAVEAVKKNAHAMNNAALQLATEKGHIVVVERLLAIEAVKENAHANDNYVLEVAASKGHLTIVFIIAKTYQSLNRQLPADITIQNQTLDNFVKDYQEKLENTANELISIFPRALLKIIDDYAEMALGTIINKPMQQNQAFEPLISLSEPPLPAALTFSIQTATIFSHISPNSPSSHRDFNRRKSKKEKK